jgi:Bacteriophage protein of unknown function (DUF646).
MDNGFDFANMEEFKQQIADVANQFPATAEKHLKKIGNKFKKIVKQKSPDSGNDSKKKLNKSWKSEVKGYSGEELSMDIWSTSPHFHLVDRGHVQKTPGGRVTGFVQGKHFLEATAQEVEAEVVPAEIEKLYDEISKKLGD